MISKVFFTWLSEYDEVQVFLLDREPGGVNLAEKVTNFDMVSNDLHI